MSDDLTRVHTSTSGSAFLVIQRGAARLEVVELPAGGRVSVGRASSNRVTIPDAKCSREHCELFSRQGDWFVRDLESRNGVTVDGDRIQGDHRLTFGETIRIGACELILMDRHPDAPRGDKDEDSCDFQIIERASGTQYDKPEGGEPSAGIERMTKGQRGATELFRIARVMSEADAIEGLTRSVLDALAKRMTAEVAGILLLPEEGGASDVDRLEVSAWRGGSTIPAFSKYLSRMALEDRDAVLARNISQLSGFSQRDSLSDLSVENAICAPVRRGSDVFGVIHLYGRNRSAPFSNDDLEFTLAVADQMANHLTALRDRAELEEGLSRVRSQVAELQDQLKVETELIGKSATMDALRRMIGRVAATDATVLIRGESGVGKELVARGIHINSQRREGPFVCVNCAALSESLLESELFGHEKGAFTGASGQRQGKFEQAAGGTLFLDEVGEMSPEVQAKFLRVLEGQPFERVGGGRPIEVDVRVVTATNRDLEEAVREGTFRSDLFFRLQVIEITVAPLREHPSDIPEIAQHFVERFKRHSTTHVRGLSSRAKQKLQAHSWPGNVRELRNVIERALILCDRDLIEPEDILLTSLRLNMDASATPEQAPPQVAENVAEPSPIETSVDPNVDLWGAFIQQEMTLDDIDRMYIEAVLNYAEWNKSQAARMLNIERTTLDRRLKKYGVRRPGDEPDPETEAGAAVD